MKTIDDLLRRQRVFAILLGELQQIADSPLLHTELGMQKGLIHSFEQTIEQAWEWLYDYLIYQKIETSRAPREVVRQAVRAGIIEDATIWMDMLETRNKASHGYGRHILNQSLEAIVSQYVSALVQFTSLFALYTNDK